MNQDSIRLELSDLRKSVKEISKIISKSMKDFEKFMKKNNKTINGLDWELKKHMETVDKYQTDQEGKFNNVEQDIAELYSENQKLKDGGVKFEALHKGFMEDLEIVESKVREINSVLDRDLLKQIQEDLEIVAESSMDIKKLLSLNGQEIQGTKGMVNNVNEDVKAINILTRKQAQDHSETKTHVENLASFGTDTNSVIEMLVKKLNAVHSQVMQQEETISRLRDTTDKLNKNCMRTYIVD